MRADQLKKGEIARIIHIDVEPFLKKRLFFMGVHEGERIRYIMSSPFYDPLLFMAAGNWLLLRKDIAKQIEVEVGQ